MNRRVIVIAGPNGAGKTTFEREFLFPSWWTGGIAMTKRPIEASGDEDLRASGLALARAARRARELAVATRTRLVIVEEGQLLRVDPRVVPVNEIQEPQVDPYR